MYYASVADVIEISATPGGNANTNITAANKATLLRYIRTISRRIDLDFAARRPVFLPYRETRKFLVESDRIDSDLNTFHLGAQLLELTALTIGTTALTIGTQVNAYPDPDMPPFNALRLARTLSWYDYCETDGAPLFATVTGIWGVNRDWSNAWLAVDALAAGINSSAQTLTVADADGENVYGFAPRLSAGQLVRIESEYLLVFKVDANTNTLTVQRGVHGSTPAAHSASAAVEVFQVEDPIRQVTARQAAFIWARQGAYTAVQVDGMSEVRYPPDLLAELRAVEQDYANDY